MILLNKFSKISLTQKKSPDSKRGDIIRFLPDGTGFIINPPGVLKEPPTKSAGFHKIILMGRRADL